MDVRNYYRKVREADATLKGERFVMISVATPDGGKEGVSTEAPRTIAAKLLAEGRARVASEEEARAFYQAIREAKAKYDEEEAARRVQVMVIPSHDLKKQRERG
jgi:hypothetical protein